MFHYSFLCKQVWDGAHPCWDAPSQACVSISNKAQQCQIKLEVKLTKNSLYDASPELRTTYSTKLTPTSNVQTDLMRLGPWFPRGHG